jgi:hypothetical protein
VPPEPPGRERLAYPLDRSPAWRIALHPAERFLSAHRFWKALPKLRVRADPSNRRKELYFAKSGILVYARFELLRDFRDGRGIGCLLQWTQAPQKQILKNRIKAILI